MMHVKVAKIPSNLNVNVSPPAVVQNLASLSSWLGLLKLMPFGVIYVNFVCLTLTFKHSFSGITISKETVLFWFLDISIYYSII